MTGFDGSPHRDGGKDRRIAALVVVVVLAFIGIAVAKPWGSRIEPPATPGPSLAEATPPSASPPRTAPQTPGAPTPVTIDPSGTAWFTTPVPPPAGAAWSALRWRRLTPDDPLSLVASVLRWRGGFIALGRDVTSFPTTPVWTSTDGVDWQPLPFNTASTFWPGTLVPDVVESPGGLVALTSVATNCRGASCPLAFMPPTFAWTSPDGRAWTPQAPIDWLTSPIGSAPLVTSGPAGLVAASSGPAARVAVSSDGIAWRNLPKATLPAGFALNDLRGTPTGYVAGGAWLTGTNRQQAATLWSADGRHWSRTPALLPTLAPTSPGLGSQTGSAMAAFVAGPDGVIAVGRGVTAPGATLWWQSRDGRTWTALPTFQPLGPTPSCTGEWCGQHPDGAIAGDGQRLVAIRGGADARAWVSADGSSWREIPVSGDLPGAAATQATLLPGGVLLTDGSTTWFGEAIAP
jgi:hypothetical protein